MSQKKLWLGIVAIFFTVQLPCFADWQFTRWGMSPQEFVEATPTGLELRGSNDKCSGKYSSDWQSGDLNFTACYTFGKEGLTRVTLSLKQPTVENAFTLKNLLERKYGRPTPDYSLENLGISILQWRTEREIISYSEQLIKLGEEDTTFARVYYETLNLPGVDGL